MSVALIVEQLELHIEELDEEIAGLQVERARASAALVALRGEVTVGSSSTPAVTKPAKQATAKKGFPQ